MDIKSLMSGIAVVIDDELEKDENIGQIVKEIEEKWEIPFYKTEGIPSDSICDNLLQTASFILLDWKLWLNGAEKSGIESNIRFLEKAKNFFVPVFIFTNEDPLDVIDNLTNPDLSEPLYYRDKEERNFIFIKRKEDLIKENIFDPMTGWIRKNASVYTLKAWERAFYESKKSLFSSMYRRNPNWPKVFWKSYKDDDVDPNSSMTRLINDMMLGRIKTDISEGEFFNPETSDRSYDESGEDIRSLISEASFVKAEKLPNDEIRSGDLFELKEGEYLINIRPDCDCIPRRKSGEIIDNVKLYCITGKVMENRELKQKYSKKYGIFFESIGESISFNLYEGKTIRFDFKNLKIKKFSKIRDKKIGRLIHPHITRMQQRYALYLQRQGLPRIPKEAMPKKPEDS